MELTESAYEGTVVAEVVETFVLDFTLMVTSVTQEAPFEPHAFTWSTCVPVEEEMLLLMVWLLTTVVSLLLSNDQPMAVTLRDEQVDEEAESVNGEETVESFEGLLTVTPARAGSESVRTAEDVTIRFLKSFIDFPLRFEGVDSHRLPTSVFASAGRNVIRFFEWAVLRGTKEMYQVLLLSNL